jgi:hypothetical protein
VERCSCRLLWSADFLWGSLHILIHESGHVPAALMVGSRIKQVAITQPYRRPYMARRLLETGYGACSTSKRA